MKNKKRLMLFRTQLFYMLFPVVIIPALLVGFFSYQVSFSALQSRSNQDVERISELANKNLDIVLQDMVQLSKLPLYDIQIQKVLSYYSNNPDIAYPDTNDVTFMDRFLYNLMSINHGIQSVFVFTKGSVYFGESVTGSISGDPDWKNRKWYLEAMEANDQHILMPTHEIKFDVDRDGSTKTSIFSLVRQIKDTVTFQTIGCILINIDVSVIKQVVETSQENSDTKFIVFDKLNQWIYPAEGDKFRAEIENLATFKQLLQKGEKQYKWRDKQYFISSSTSKYSNWTVAARVPKSSLTKSIESIYWTTFTVFGLTVLVALILFFILISLISKPVTQLRHLIKRLEVGDMDVNFESRGAGEIVVLGQSFNRMVSRLKQLIQDVYESQILRQRAELSALRSQINPHFLYNTLESFQMIAITEGNDRLARMSNALGQLMRSALNVDEIILVEQELVHIENYLILIKERFEERLNYHIEFPLELYSYQIPKLMLQPIVENAVYHGIDPKIGPGQIRIVGYRDNDKLVVEIMDDGVGIPPDKLELIQQELNSDYNVLERSNKIGIFNIQAQIRNQFSSLYGITIEAIATGGLKVTVSLPIIPMRRADETK